MGVELRPPGPRALSLNSSTLLPPGLNMGPVSALIQGKERAHHGSTSNSASRDTTDVHMARLESLPVTSYNLDVTSLALVSSSGTGE